MPKLLMQVWIENERGWGTRPDGISLHLSHVALMVYIKSYWDSMSDEVQEEYSCPDGDPQWIDVTEKTYERVASQPSSSIRIWHHELPKQGESL